MRNYAFNRPIVLVLLSVLLVAPLKANADRSEEESSIKQSSAWSALSSYLPAFAAGITAIGAVCASYLYIKNVRSNSANPSMASGVVPQVSLPIVATGIEAGKQILQSFSGHVENGPGGEISERVIPLLEAFFVLRSPLKLEPGDIKIENELKAHPLTLASSAAAAASPEPDAAQSSSASPTQESAGQIVRHHFDGLRAHFHKMAVLRGLPPEQHRLFMHGINHRFLEIAAHVADRLQKGLSDEDLRQHYGDLSLTVAEITGAPVLLLAQTHLDIEGVLRNFILTQQILTQEPAAVVLLEAFESIHQPALLAHVLGHIAFIDHLARNPHISFRDPEARTLRTAYFAFGTLFTGYFRSRQIDLPLLHATGRGWDLIGDAFSNSDRNRNLLRSVLQVSQEGRRAIVHLGVMHAPGYYRQSLEEGFPHLRSLPRLAPSTQEAWREIQVLTEAIAVQQELEARESISELENDLPRGFLELRPLSSTHDRQASALSLQSTQAEACAQCGKDAKSHCGRCKDRHYCSKDCQKLDWAEHKKHCTKKSL